MYKEEKREEYKSYNERFVRWQQTTIGQMSFTNNLFLGLNLGFLGFYTTQSGLSFNCNCILFTLNLLTLLGLIISFITGILLVINRLIDFRNTTQLVKYRKKKFEIDHNLNQYKDDEFIEASIIKLKITTERLGNRTWILLNWQILTFAIGTIFGVIILITKNYCG